METLKNTPITAATKIEKGDIIVRVERTNVYSQKIGSGYVQLNMVNGATKVEETIWEVVTLRKTKAGIKAKCKSLDGKSLGNLVFVPGAKIEAIYSKVELFKTEVCL